MRPKYYKITGLDEGIPIKPFAVTADELDDAVTSYGDSCRYYEPIDYEEYLKLRSKQQFYTTPKDNNSEDEVSPVFNKVINLLLDYKWVFQVLRSDMLADDDPIRQYLPDNKDVRFLYVIVGNTDYVVWDYDTESLEDLYAEIENF